jgi:hypothetical protein
LSVCDVAHATIVQMAGKSYRLRTRAAAEPTVTRALDVAGAMDAENAPTAPWKSLRDFHKRPPPSLLVMTLRTDKRRRAFARLDSWIEDRKQEYFNI